MGEVMRRELFVHTLRQWRSVSGTPSTNERQKKTDDQAECRFHRSDHRAGIAGGVPSQGLPGGVDEPEGKARGNAGQRNGPAATPRRARRRGRRTRRNMTKSNQGNRCRRRSRPENQTAGQRGKPTDARPSGQGNQPEYSPQQREQVRDGLRVLARIIARAHLRRQDGSPRSE